MSQNSNNNPNEKHVSSVEGASIINNIRKIAERFKVDVSLSDFVDKFDKDSFERSSIRPTGDGWVFHDTGGFGAYGRMTSIILNMGLSARFAYKLSTKDSSALSIGNVGLDSKISDVSAKVAAWSELLKACYSKAGLEVDIVAVKESAKIINAAMLEMNAVIPYAYGDGKSICIVKDDGLLRVNSSNIDQVLNDCVSELSAIVAFVIGVILNTCLKDNYDIFAEENQNDLVKVSSAVNLFFYNQYCKQHLYNAVKYRMQKKAEKEANSTAKSTNYGCKQVDADEALKDYPDEDDGADPLAQKA